MDIRGITKADYDHLVMVLDRWWGGPSGQHAHPMFLYELGEYALVAEERGEIVGFLLGFITRGGAPTGYIHLVGIHPEHRRHGVGKALYDRFMKTCEATGVRRLKTISAVGYEGPLAFHRALGFDAHEDPDYAGPGRGRVVFTKDL
ncbi:MAG: GNAT family N-acetyltransferase [Polyangiaceae bacterium]|nr:GNAT family N-acetyltransferase [Polyangiaceae bacterium]